MAEQALSSDKQSLENLMGQLAQAMQSRGQRGDSSEMANRLNQLMNSAEMRAAMAMAMAQRRQQMSNETMQNQEGQPPQPAQLPAPSQNPLSQFANITGGVEEIMTELDDVDLAAYTVIMRMQPKSREEILQGVREEGPQGYRQFIREYFRLLTESQEKKYHVE